MPNYSIKSPENNEEWESYLLFRWEVLRKPLGMSKESLADSITKLDLNVCFLVFKVEKLFLFSFTELNLLTTLLFGDFSENLLFFFEEFLFLENILDSGLLLYLLLFFSE